MCVGVCVHGIDTLEGGGGARVFIQAHPPTCAPTPPQARTSCINWIVYHVQQDKHYKHLLPLLGPVSLFFITWNWFGLKLFRHNA